MTGVIGLPGILVRVKLFASLRRHRPASAAGPDFVQSLTSGSTVEALLEQLGINGAEAAIVLAGGERRDPGYPLKDGDEVAIFPPMGGG